MLRWHGISCISNILMAWKSKPALMQASSRNGAGDAQAALIGALSCQFRVSNANMLTKMHHALKAAFASSIMRRVTYALDSKSWLRLMSTSTPARNRELYEYNGHSNHEARLSACAHGERAPSSTPAIYWKPMYNFVALSRLLRNTMKLAVKSFLAIKSCWNARW